MQITTLTRPSGRVSTGLLVMTLLTLASPTTGASAVASRDLADLTFDELLQVRIVSASRADEPLGEAPATVIVLTREQIHHRGYTQLSEIFDDLPGMDVIRPFGATYLKNYWRGYRNTIGDPYLILLDGLELNHLYFNTADILVGLPLVAVERIEVVYGPASSVYGANAFMGVVNIITGQPETGDGTALQGMVGGGSQEQRLADLVATYREGGFSLRLAARVDNGELADGSNERYEYTRDRYYGDRALWGGFIDNPSIAGRFSSPHRHRAADLRLGLGQLELGLLWARLENGYGLEYAGDRAQNNGVWSRPEVSAFLRTERELTESVTSTTSLRYRQGGVGNDSTWLEAVDVDGDERRRVRYTYWQSLSSSWAVQQAFAIRVSDQLEFNAGLEWEQKSLQKAYQITYGPALLPEEVNASTYPYPPPPPDVPQAQNRISTDDLGGYVQGRLRLNPSHRLHLGVRHDDNSQYGGATTVRAGWVGSWGRFTAKALYGEAFQEPNPRVLYGGWTGSGSDPTLDPEASRTAEVSATWTNPSLTFSASLYRIRNDDTIVSTATGARNLGDRSVTGLDLHAEGRQSIGDRLRWRWWAYYSHLIEAEEAKLDDDGNRIGRGAIGDLAEHKLMAGATVHVGAHLSATLRGRFVSSRDTVDTNPVGTVPSYTTVDAVVTFDDLLAEHLGVSIKISNLLDEDYFHPGVREADAGLEPGTFDAEGRWHGSAGYYSSLLPQPGRSLIATLHFGF